MRQLIAISALVALMVGTCACSRMPSKDTKLAKMEVGLLAEDLAFLKQEFKASKERTTDGPKSLLDSAYHNFLIALKKRNRMIENAAYNLCGTGDVNLVRKSIYAAHEEAFGAILETCNKITRDMLNAPAGSTRDNMDKLIEAMQSRLRDRMDYYGEGKGEE
jgi:hypothetical protein